MRLRNSSFTYPQEYSTYRTVQPITNTTCRKPESGNNNTMLLRTKSSHAIAIICAALLFGIASPILHAEDEENARWYQIEIILFEHTDSRNIDSEKWPLEHNLPVLEKAAELAALTPPGSGKSPTGTALLQGTTQDNAATDTALPATAQPLLIETPEITRSMPHTTYPPVNASEMQLTSLYQKLQRSSRHSPILHLAWRQPTVDKGAAIPLHIHGGMQYAQPAHSLETLIERTGEGSDLSGYPPVTSIAPTMGTGLQPENRSMQPGVAEWVAEPVANLLEQIDGTITISRARYLHVWTDLIYRTPRLPQGYLTSGAEIVPAHTPAPDGSSVPVAQPVNINMPYNSPVTGADVQDPLFSLRIQDHRRMRSKEIHYMDHPLVGMIILATPYELPEPEPVPVPELKPETPADTINNEPRKNTTGARVENNS